MTGWLDILRISESNLYYFQESLWYNIILKLLSISYMYKLNDVYWNDKIKMSRWNALCMHNINGQKQPLGSVPWR